MDLIKLCLKDFSGLYIDSLEWITSTENGKIGEKQIMANKVIDRSEVI